MITESDDARRVVDVYLRPFYEQPFEVGGAIALDVTTDDPWWLVSFTYGEDQTQARARVVEFDEPATVYVGPAPEEPTAANLRNPEHWELPKQESQE